MTSPSAAIDHYPASFLVYPTDNKQKIALAITALGTSAAFFGIFIISKSNIAFLATSLPFASGVFVMALGAISFTVLRNNMILKPELELRKTSLSELDRTRGDSPPIVRSDFPVEIRSLLNSPLGKIVQFVTEQKLVQETDGEYHYIYEETPLQRTHRLKEIIHSLMGFIKEPDIHPRQKMKAQTLLRQLTILMQIYNQEKSIPETYTSTIKGQNISIHVSHDVDKGKFKIAFNMNNVVISKVTLVYSKYEVCFTFKTFKNLLPIDSPLLNDLTQKMLQFIIELGEKEHVSIFKTQFNRPDLFMNILENWGFIKEENLGSSITTYCLFHRPDFRFICHSNFFSSLGDLKQPALITLSTGEKITYEQFFKANGRILPDPT